MIERDSGRISDHRECDAGRQRTLRGGLADTPNMEETVDGLDRANE
jgi:hypothetical protein